MMADAVAASGGGGKRVVEGKHVITFHPPGLPRAFDVSFPPRRLPVCDRCKKNYKSRDLCRTRDGHKTLPWTKTYIVITIDKSCILTDESGNNFYADVPMVAKLCGTPTSCSGPSDGSMKHEPICQTCRDKNYTRDYCRNTCSHTSPPWSSVYVRLQRDDSPKDSERESKPPAKKRKKNQSGNSKTVSGEGGKDSSSAYQGQKDAEEKEKSSKMGKLDFSSFERVEEEDEPSDDLTAFHPSKTFLAAVSSKSISVRWCEDIEYPENTSNNGMSQMKMDGMPSNMGMDYLAQQHQGIGNSYDAYQASQMQFKKQSKRHRDDTDTSKGDSRDGNTGGNIRRGSQGNGFDPSNAPNLATTMMGMGANFPNMPSNMQQNPLWDAFRAGAMWAQAQGGNVTYGSMMNHQTMATTMAFFAQQPQAAGMQGLSGQGAGRGEAIGGSQGSSNFAQNGAMMGGPAIEISGGRQPFGVHGEEKPGSVDDDGGNDMFGPPIKTEKLL